MSTIDSRVVEMKFDNSNFESNVKTSMSTLDKLKGSLDMSSVTGALETVTTKFSALEIAAISAISTITTQAVTCGEQLLSSLSVDQIAAGWEKFASKTTSVGTLISQGYDIETVTEQLERLNWYTDETSYNFTDMVANIAKFTASGQDLETSVTAMEGIANWAALSGQNASTASRAMYQLAQAMSAGYMRLEDYKSIQNASMDTEEFRQQCIDAAIALGTLQDNADGTYTSIVDGASSATFTLSSFTTGLTEGCWLTSDVMMDVFNNYSNAVDQIYDYAEEKGITASEAIEELGDSVDEFGLKAFKAAQEARTWTDVIDSVKDAVSTGWMNTFEIIFGNYEEATELWTDLANAMWDVFAAGAEDRNDMLETWKELGGRTVMIDAFWTAWENIGEILGTVKEAFREVFPKTTADQLYSLTLKVKELTENFKMSEESLAKLKSTFKGVFSVVDIFWQAIKAVTSGITTLISSLSPAANGFLSLTGSIGDAITKVDEFIKENDIFGTVVDKIVGILVGVIEAITSFKDTISEGLDTEEYSGFATLLDAIRGAFELIISVAKKAKTAIGDVFSNLGGSSTVISGVISLLSGVAEAIGLVIEKVTDYVRTFGDGSVFQGILNIFTALASGKLVFNLSSFGDGLRDLGKSFSSIKSIFSDVLGILTAYQEQLKAKTLVTIATAIALLAASFVAISLIDSAKLGAAVGVITALFAELVAAMTVMSKFGTKGSMGMSVQLIAFAGAMAILAGALDTLAGISSDRMLSALVGLGVAMAEIVAMSEIMSSSETKLLQGATNVVIFAAGMKVLASALEDLSQFSWGGLLKSLTAMAAILAELVVFSKLADQIKLSSSVGLIAIATAMVIFSSSIEKLGSLNIPTLAKGLVSMGLALTEVAIALQLMPSNMISMGIGLIAVSTALTILSSAMTKFGQMSLAEIGKSLLVLAGGLAEIVVALNLMNGTAGAAASMLIMASAIAILVPCLKLLGSLSLTQIAAALITLAGAFLVIGVAGAVLAPIVTPILGLAAAFALIGAATLGLGAGLLAVAAGLGAITAVAVPAAEALAGFIPAFIVAFVTGIVDAVPTLVDAFVTAIKELCKSLAENIPEIAGYLFDFILGILDALANYMPQLVQSALNLIGAFFTAFADALNGMDSEVLENIITSIGLITTIIIAIGACKPFISAAKSAVLQLGIVVAELGALLAAFGALGQIPGLKWLIYEGGELLGAIGTAIGDFFGGIVGGFMDFATATLPNVGTNLSLFMENIQGFIEGAKNIDSSVLTGIGNLAGAIVLISAANLMESVTAFLTGGNSFTKFGEELAEFGPQFAKFADSVSDINTDAVNASADAIQALSVMAANLPNEGGVISWFTGDNTLAMFAEGLAEFGPVFADYANSISGITNMDVVAESANAAMALAEMAANLPNQNGVVSWFTGDNTLSSFAEGLADFGPVFADYANSISGISNMNVIVESATAASALAEMAANLPNQGGVVSWFAGDNTLAMFAEGLAEFGPVFAKYAKSVSGITNMNVVVESANAAMALAELAMNLPNQGGIVSWFTGDNTLAMFAKELAEFGPVFADYAKAISGITNMDVVVESAQAAIALAEFADSLPNQGGIVSWISGDNTLTKFANGLAEFGPVFADYAESVNGITNMDVVVESANAAMALAEFADGLPNQGGIVSWVSGDNTLVKFAEGLSEFGPVFAKYAKSLRGITNMDVVTESASAALALAEMVDNLPNQGGIVSWFTGDNTLVKFAEGLSEFGPVFAKYAKSLRGVTNMDVVVESASAALALAEFANNLPNEGGAVSWFTGDNTLADFAEALEPFGEAFAKYAKSISGITNMDVVTASATAATALAEMADTLPDQGGISSWFTGDYTLTDFAEDLEPFGEAFAEYAKAISGVTNMDAVTASAVAATALAEMADTLPDPNNLLAWFTGDYTLTDFAEDLEPFGEAFAEYAASISGITNMDVVTASATAATALAEMVDTLPDQGGISSWFTGDYTLVDFAKGLAEFGPVFADYAKSISGITNMDVVVESASAALALAEMADTLPDQGGISSWFTGDYTLTDFAEDLEPFGESFAKYAKAISGITNMDVVTASAVAATALAELADALPEEGGLASIINGDASLSNFGTSLVSFGKSLAEYANSVKDVSIEKLDAVLVEFDKLVDIAQGISDVDTSSVSGFATSLTDLANAGIDGFIDAFDDATDRITSAAVSIIQTFIDGANSKEKDLTKAFTALIQKGLSKLDDSKSDFKECGKTLIEEFMNGVLSKTDDLDDKFTSMADNAVKAVRGCYTDFYSAGEYLVKGFANGIANNTYLSTAKAKALAKAAAKAIDDELDINSPSKVAYSKGDYFGMGFVSAIDDWVDGAYAASSDMANAASEGLSSAISTIADELDSDLDTEPVIRPVLDLSEIQNGADQLYLLMSDANGYSLSGSLGTVNSTAKSIEETQKRRESLAADSEGNTLNDLIDVVRNMADKPAQTFSNVFNITGNNPQEIADEVSRRIQHQVERKSASWA